MNKKEFLEKLERNLKGLSKEDTKEILDDYKEHFKVGLKKKRKESEIVESLGNPKEIALETKKELMGDKENFDFPSSIMRFFFDIGRVSKKAWKKIKGDVSHAQKKFKDRKNRNYRRWKIFGLVSLNILVMIWILIAFYAVVFSLIVVGFSLILSGLAAIAFSIFILSNNPGFLMKNFSLSGVFAGISVTCLGFLWTIGSFYSGKGLSWLVKKYMQSTKRWTRK